MNRNNICYECGEGFYSETDLKKHQRVMHLDHACEVCGKSFNSQGELIDHERRKHRSEQRLPAREYS